ncbi:MAG: Stp1/IreP family PP2C-type Ser/Thr phosphatase [Myxococcales bacterium]|nr:Stp1/IreP family PP2C-type Ser/Thr phosphatase [Myxococcales bacterium]
METTALAHTHIGQVKPTNEDAWLIEPSLQLFMVADGMGGHAAGEVASAMAVDEVRRIIGAEEALLRRFAETGKGRGEILQLLEDAVRNAGRAIYDTAQADASKRGMGTTSSLLLLTPTRGFIAHVGDSRVYLIRQGEVFQLTEDHSLINEMIRRGRLKPEEAKRAPYKNAVTRAVGVYADVQVDTLDFEVATGDQFLLCSDGLTEHVDVLAEVVGVLDGKQPGGPAAALVDMANKRGGKDNITALVVRVESGGQDARRVKGPHEISLKLNVLRHMPLFQHLTYVELVEVLNVSDVHTFGAGELVFDEGSLGEEMFVVLEGMVSIRKGNVELARLGPGGHFGEMAIMDKGPRSARVTAEQASRLIAVGRRPLFALMRRDKEIAVKLLWCFVQVLNQRLRVTNADLLRARLDKNELQGLLHLDDFD